MKSHAGKHLIPRITLRLSCTKTQKSLLSVSLRVPKRNQSSRSSIRRRQLRKKVSSSMHHLCSNNSADQIKNSTP